jgi:hypothetical protein
VTNNLSISYVQSNNDDDYVSIGMFIEGHQIRVKLTLQEFALALVGRWIDNVTATIQEPKPPKLNMIFQDGIHD